MGNELQEKNSTLIGTVTSPLIAACQWDMPSPTGLAEHSAGTGGPVPGHSIPCGFSLELWWEQVVFPPTPGTRMRTGKGRVREPEATSQLEKMRSWSEGVQGDRMRAGDAC